MAAMTGLRLPSMRSRTACRLGSVGGLPNSVMSAPAMNVRPAHTMTIALASASAAAALRPSARPWRTCWLSAFTGELLTVRTATRPRRSRSTDLDMAVMGVPLFGEIKRGLSYSVAGALTVGVLRTESRPRGARGRDGARSLPLGAGQLVAGDADDRDACRGAGPPVDADDVAGRHAREGPTADGRPLPVLRAQERSGPGI